MYGFVLNTKKELGMCFEELLNVMLRYCGIVYQPLELLNLLDKRMFTASCSLKTQPCVRGKCLLYRYGPPPTVTSRQHYRLADRSRCARPVCIGGNAVPDTSLAQRLAFQSSAEAPAYAEPVRRVGLPGAATAA